MQVVYPKVPFALKRPQNFKISLKFYLGFTLLSLNLGLEVRPLGLHLGDALLHLLRGQEILQQK